MEWVKWSRRAGLFALLALACGCGFDGNELDCSDPTVNTLACAYVARGQPCVSCLMDNQCGERATAAQLDGTLCEIHSTPRESQECWADWWNDHVHSQINQPARDATASIADLYRGGASFMGDFCRVCAEPCKLRQPDWTCTGKYEWEERLEASTAHADVRFAVSDSKPMHGSLCSGPQKAESSTCKPLNGTEPMRLSWQTFAAEPFTLEPDDAGGETPSTLLYPRHYLDRMDQPVALSLIHKDTLLDRITDLAERLPECQGSSAEELYECWYGRAPYAGPEPELNKDCYGSGRGTIVAIPTDCRHLVGVGGVQLSLAPAEGFEARFKDPQLGFEPWSYDQQAGLLRGTTVGEGGGGFGPLSPGKYIVRASYGGKLRACRTVEVCSGAITMVWLYPLDAAQTRKIGNNCGAEPDNSNGASLRVGAN